MVRYIDIDELRARVKEPSASGREACGEEPSARSKEPSARGKEPSASGRLAKNSSQKSRRPRAGLPRSASQERATVYDSAMSMLALREHSVAELSGKLHRRFAADVVDEVIADLRSKELVCDWRYAEALCRRRISRGYGPLYIQQELQQKGVSGEITRETLDDGELVWTKRARTLAEKKWLQVRRPIVVDEENANLQIDHRQTAEDRERMGRAKDKVARYLSRRGFSARAVVKALESLQAFSES